MDKQSIRMLNEPREVHVVPSFDYAVVSTFEDHVANGGKLYMMSEPEGEYPFRKAFVSIDKTMIPGHCGLVPMSSIGQEVILSPECIETLRNTKGFGTKLCERADNGEKLYMIGEPSEIGIVAITDLEVIDDGRLGRSVMSIGVDVNGITLVNDMYNDAQDFADAIANMSEDGEQLEQ